MSRLNGTGVTRILNYIKTWVTNLLSGKANTSHTHTKSQITDFPTIPSNISQLTNDSGYITSEIDSMGEGWIRFKSGLQICWGVIAAAQIEPFNGHYGKLISYPKSFLANTEPVVNISQWRESGNLTQNVNICGVAESYARIETDAPWGVYYTVFGMWK